MGEVKPLRIQLRRTKGWRKPANTVVCSRPGRWGNPFVVEEMPSGFWMVSFNGWSWQVKAYKPEAIAYAIELFSIWLRQGRIDVSVEDIRRELSNRNLACWCRLCPAHSSGKPLDVDCPDCAPCHVDVLGRVLFPREGAR